MYKKLLLILMFISVNSTLDFYINASAHQSRNESAKVARDEINKNLDLIYKFSQANNDYALCKEARNVVELIKNNKEDLYRIEPQHSWIDIQEVANDLILRHCD